MPQVSDASERQIAHLRAQAATSSGQHLEALRKAQDICSQTEAKADAAERYSLLPALVGPGKPRVCVCVCVLIQRSQNSSPVGIKHP